MFEPTPADLLIYPHFPEGEIKLLGHFDWFDGPMNGVVLHLGNYYWFQAFFDDDEGKDTFYFLYPLIDDDLKNCRAFFERLQEFANALKPFENPTGHLQTPEAAALGAFQEQARADFRAKMKVFSSHKPVGWFSSSGNSSFAGVILTEKNGVSYISPKRPG